MNNEYILWSPTLESASLILTTPHIVKEIRKVTEINNYILDKFPTEYTEQAVTHASRIFHFMCSMQVSKSSWWL